MAVDFVSRSAQGPEPRAQLVAEEFGLLPGGEVAAFVDLVVMDELGVSPFYPTPRSCIDLIREDAHGNRDGDVLRGKEGLLVFPIQTRGRDRRIRQPIERNVVEHIVSCKALRLTVKDTRHEREAERIMVEYPRGEANR